MSRRRHGRVFGATQGGDRHSDPPVPEPFEGVAELHGKHPLGEALVGALLLVAEHDPAGAVGERGGEGGGVAVGGKVEHPVGLSKEVERPELVEEDHHVGVAWLSPSAAVHEVVQVDDPIGSRRWRTATERPAQITHGWGPPPGRSAMGHRDGRLLAGVRGHVTLTYMSDTSEDQAGAELALLRQRLAEAEGEYRRTQTEDYVVRLVRDATIVDAHRGGMSSREISALVGDIGQPNVVRTRRRAITRRDVVPHGLLDPADAVRASGMGPAAFISAVRDGRIKPRDLADGLKAFRAEDVEGLAATAESRHGWSTHTCWTL